MLKKLAAVTAFLGFIFVSATTTAGAATTTNDTNVGTQGVWHCTEYLRQVGYIIDGRIIAECEKGDDGDFNGCFWGLVSYGIDFGHAGYACDVAGSAPRIATATA